MVKKDKKGLFSRLTFTGLSIILSVLLLLSYVSLLINPAKAWYMTIFGLIYPFIATLCGCCLVWGLFRKAWIADIILLFVLAPSIILIGRYFQFNGRPVDGTKGDLKVVSYNVGLFAHGREEYASKTRLELADAVSDYLLGLDADVICLQEFYLPTGVSPSFYFRQHFPGYTAEYYVLTGKKGRAGNVTLTRFPVISKGHIQFEKSTNMAIYTDLDVKGTKLRVYNCHFESYNISIPHLIHAIRDDGIIEANGRKFRRSARVRPRQVDEVMANIEACREQALVVGDFNDTPFSYTYHRLSRDRKDAFLEVGKGFGATYSKLWPMLRIDYILYPQSLEARWYSREDAVYSDHYPIVSSFLK